jgi:hypothetical protein
VYGTTGDVASSHKKEERLTVEYGIYKNGTIVEGPGTKERLDLALDGYADKASMRVERYVGDRRPNGKRKRSGGPTAASIDRQKKRLDKASEATAEAEKYEEAQRTARKKEAEAYDSIEKKKREIKDLQKDAKSLKSAAITAAAKARVQRVKAAKLAKG